MPELNRDARWLIAGPLRLGVMKILFEEKEVTPSELAKKLGKSIQNVSPILSKSYERGMVDFEEEGRHRFYFLTESGVEAYKLAKKHKEKT